MKRHLTIMLHLFAATLLCSCIEFVDNNEQPDAPPAPGPSAPASPEDASQAGTDVSPAPLPTPPAAAVDTQPNQDPKPDSNPPTEDPFYDGKLDLLDTVNLRKDQGLDLLEIQEFEEVSVLTLEGAAPLEYEVLIYQKQELPAHLGVYQSGQRVVDIDAQKIFSWKISHGQELNFELYRVHDNDVIQLIKAFQFQIPTDWQPPSNMYFLDQNLAINARRVFLPSYSIIEIGTFNLSFQCKKFFSDSATIQSFAKDRQRLPLGNPGRNSGNVKLEAEMAMGRINIEVSGENGEVGISPTPWTQPAPNGAPGRPDDVMFVGQFPICVNYGTNGSDGAPGAPGGNGGPGGAGGNSGTVELAVERDSRDFIHNIHASPGAGGQGGVGTPGQLGGLGGRAGKSEIDCHPAHSPLLPGADGPPGRNGESGPNGVHGQKMPICIQIGASAPACS